MGEGVWIVCGVVGFACLVCGMIGSGIAEAKGRPSGEGFALGLFLGPLGLLIVALMPRSVEKEAKRQLEIEWRKEQVRAAVERRKEQVRGEVERLKGARRAKPDPDEEEAAFWRWREEEGIDD